MDSTIHSINYFIISLNPHAGKRKRILPCGSYRGIFVIRDPLNSINYSSCSVTKWLSVLEENSWFYYSFFPDFQFRDLRKINKDYERVKWEWWIFVSCYLQYCFFFRHFQGVFQTFLLPLFSLRKKKIKNGIRADLCDSKAEMKVWYPWFVIRYFFGPRTVPEEPTLRHLCHPLRSDRLHERALGPTLPPRDIPRLSRKKKFSLWPYNKSFIDQVCSAKMAGYCPRFFAF